MVRVSASSKRGGGWGAGLPGDGASAYRLAVGLVLGSVAVLAGSYVYLFSGVVTGGGGKTAGGAGEGSSSLGHLATNGGSRGAKSSAGAAGGGIRRASGEGVTAPNSAAAAGGGGAGGGSSAVRDTVGYAISITGCGEDPLIDGAAVLAHSIRLSSSANPASGSRYNYQMYAIVHPAAESCAPLSGLRTLGYEVLIRDVPVKVEDIEGEYLRTKVVDNGCCGEKEFIKLEAFTLVQHPVVVHLDLDTLVLRPLDELYDAMLDGPSSSGTVVPTHAGAPLPAAGPIDSYFTRDYNMVRPGKPHVGVQGGFLVLRPSLEAYEEFKSVIRKGDFRSNGGWGGKGFGPFYGSMTFQGIVPYFYDELHPGTGVELDRCVYNQMCDNPRDEKTVNDVVHGKCRDGRDDCPDCRSRPLEDVRTAHFTLCQKPWWCLPHDADRIQDRLCRKLHGEWFRIRDEWERSRAEGGGGGVGSGEGTFQKEQFRGWCKGRGKTSYVPVKVS